MGYIESLSSYPHHWKSCFVTHLLIWRIDCPAKLTQGWSCHHSVFFHSDLVESTNGKHTLLLLTPTLILLHPFPYADISKKPSNTMLDSVNPVTSAVPKRQLIQPENPKSRVYGSKDEVWPHVIFPAGHIGKKGAGTFCL